MGQNYNYLLRNSTFPYKNASETDSERIEKEGMNQPTDRPHQRG